MQMTAIQRRYSLEERIRRAEQLANQWPFAAEMLRTYVLIAQFQKSLSVLLKQSNFNGRSHQRLPREVDLNAFVGEFRSLLRTATSAAPQELSASARGCDSFDADHLLQLANAYWADSAVDISPTETFLLRSFLQPIAEHFAEDADIPVPECRIASCPFCGRKPVCGILRGEGDGAKRSLLCSFCSTEWEYRRLICPACEQEEVEQLPVYTAEEFGYIRVEACDRCKTFIKTVDLTRDGRAIPMVDELGSVPLTLWAEQNGYQKLQRNLLLM